MKTPKYRSIDPAQLHDLLDYDPSIGIITWKSRPNQPKWNARYAGREAMAGFDRKGYRRSQILGAPVAVHRVIWAMVHGEWPKADIDHINGKKADNRIANLRAVTRQDNNRNKAKRKDNTSGVTGVTWDRSRQAWAARIRHNGRNKALGRFATVEAAAEARERAMREYGYHENHGRPA